MHKIIFITGAYGFIGKNLLDFFQAKGYTVMAPSSSELNLLDEAAVDDFMAKNKIDIIIHAANKGGARNTHGMQNIVNINLRMFFNIVKHADSVEKIIHFGSGAEYGKHKPIIDVSEEDAEIAFPIDDYGFYKSVCSRYIQKSRNIINLRIFGCYGKYEDYRFKFISNAIVKNLLGLPIVIQQNVFFDYLFVDDLVQIVSWVVDHEPNKKIYNASSGAKIDLSTLADIINSISDYKSEVKIINKGCNFEYTASNHRIKSEIPNLKITPHQEAIKYLKDYYNSIIGMINRNEIIEDSLRHLCIIAKK